MTLFGDDVGRTPEPGAAQPHPGSVGAHDGPTSVGGVADGAVGSAGAVVRVVPDVPAMDRELDYSVPAELLGRVGVGTVVRVPLHGRRVRGWVVATGVAADPSLELAEVTRVSGLGPDEDVIGVCRWAAWRWAGRLPSLLRMGTPDRAVRTVSRRVPTRVDPRRLDPETQGSEAAELLRRGPGVHLLTVDPLADPTRIALAAASLGQVLVVAPQVRVVESVAAALGRAGASVARWPGGLAQAAAGHSVVGGRAAVWAPLPELAAVVVLDEHDEGLQHESSPTWHAREVAIERARRSGVPCLLVSPCPSLEARSAATSEAMVVSAARRRDGWAKVTVVDRRHDDPRAGLYSSELVEAIRRCRQANLSVVCVLNRTGRARLLACRSCGTIAECEQCAAAVQSPEGHELTCGRCGSVRPTVCLSCGATAMKVLRAGVTRAREELEALVREPVAAVTASGVTDGPAGVLIGTEAVLHRGGAEATAPVGLVAFLDMDQELLATRYRAAEESLALLVAASRLVGGRRRGSPSRPGSGPERGGVDGTGILVQTRRSGHPVLQAALRADPTPLAAAEAMRRELLQLPPVLAVAAVGGEAAPEWIDRLGQAAGVDAEQVEVQGPRDGWWLVRAEDPATLADACASVSRPPGRLRLRVDPVRLP